MALDLATAGALLYGARWKAALANDLGVSREAVRLWVAGTHPVPEAVRGRVREMLAERLDKISACLAV